MIWNSIKNAAKMMTAVGLVASATMSMAWAEYPEKPITMVIPLGAGGSHDLNARVITSIIPPNRPALISTNVSTRSAIPNPVSNCSIMMVPESVNWFHGSRSQYP